MKSFADIFWEAANIHLRSDPDSGNAERKSSFTCDTVGYAAWSRDRNKEAIALLTEMGLPRGASESFEVFKDFKHGEDRQGARYLWLMLAHTVAKDEGL